MSWDNVKRELQPIAYNHSAGISFEKLKNCYKNSTKDS